MTLAAVVEGGVGVGSGVNRLLGPLARHLLPRLDAYLLADLRVAVAAKALVAADVDHVDAWKGAQEGQRAPGLGVRLRASGVVVESDGGLGLGPEIQLVEILDQVLGDVLEREFLTHIHDVVVEENARRTPHHDLLRLELAEVGGGGLGDGVGRRFVPALVVLDAAAVGRATNGGEVHVQQFEDVYDCAHEMGGAHDVAAEIQHDVGLLDVVLGGGQQPVALFGRGLQAVEDVNLAEVVAVEAAVGLCAGHVRLLARGGQSVVTLYHLFTPYSLQSHLDRSILRTPVH